MEIKNAIGDYVAQYRFDGLNRRARQFVSQSENGWVVLENYYNNEWQAMEVRKAMYVGRSGSPLAEPSVAGGVWEQYVWSPAYVDAPVLRDRDADGNSGTGSYGRSSNGLEERMEFTRDANMKVTALVDSSGTVQERYVYDAYGKVTVYDGTWSNTRSSSAYDNDILFCGYMYDNESGLYNVRNRMYHPTLGRWNQRDVGVRHEKINLYQYVRSSPPNYLDPQGRMTEACCNDKLKVAEKDAAVAAAIAKAKQKKSGGIACLGKVKCKASCIGDPAGRYNPFSRNVSMCGEGLRDLDQATFNQTLLHELIHAESICGWWKLGCTNCMIEEKRAYFLAGQCIDDRTCTAAAWGSCKISWSCSDLGDNWNNYEGAGWPVAQPNPPAPQHGK